MKTCDLVALCHEAGKKLGSLDDDWADDGDGYIEHWKTSEMLNLIDHLLAVSEIEIEDDSCKEPGFAQNKEDAKKT